MAYLSRLWIRKGFLLVKYPDKSRQIIIRLQSLFKKSDIHGIRKVHNIPQKMSTTPETAAPSFRAQISRFWNQYLIFTENNPLQTQCATMMLFAGLGNFISQTVVEKRSLRNLDWPSIVKFATIGACVSFPIIRSWFWTLERLYPAGRFVALKKVATDQLVFAPVFLASFIVLMGFVEGNGWEDAKERLTHDWVNVMISNWELWPAAQFINFTFVPFNQRILFSGIVSLAWNVYLAFVVRRSKERGMAN